MSIIVVVSGVSIGASKATEKALPGDWGYSVKLASERIQKAMLFSDESKAKFEIEVSASRRIEEIKQLVAADQDNGQSADKIKVSLNNYKDHLQSVTEELGRLENQPEKSVATVQVATLVDEKTSDYKKVLIDLVAANIPVETSAAILNNNLNTNQAAVNTNIVIENTNQSININSATSPMNNKIEATVKDVKSDVIIAIEASDDINDKAVGLIVDKHEKGQADDLSFQQLSEKVDQKIKEAEAKASDLNTNSAANNIVSEAKTSSLDIISKNLITAKELLDKGELKSALDKAKESKDLTKSLVNIDIIGAVEKSGNSEYNGNQVPANSENNANSSVNNNINVGLNVNNSKDSQINANSNINKAVSGNVNKVN